MWEIQRKGNRGQLALLLSGGLRQWPQPSAPGFHRPLLGPVVSCPAEVTTQAPLPGSGQLRLRSGKDLLCLAVTYQLTWAERLFLLRAVSSFFSKHRNQPLLYVCALGETQDANAQP